LQQWGYSEAVAVVTCPGPVYLCAGGDQPLSGHHYVAESIRVAVLPNDGCQEHIYGQS
jgi:hypothetical protein